MRIQVVIPIYNEEENLEELFERVTEVFNQVSEVDWQLLYVNDGSSDRSLEIISKQHAKDSRIAVLNLSRNFGHQAAISAGLCCVDADAAIVMDGDLQDPPELIPSLFDKWQDGAEVVVASRQSRSETGFRRLAFDSFHSVFGWISDMPMSRDSGVFGLMDSQVVREFNRLSEQNRFLPGLRSWIGFETATVFYDRQDRAAGTPKQSFTHLFRYGFDAIFSFSYKPLRLITCLGLAASVFAIGLACFFAARRLLGIEIAQTGFTTLVILILLFGGIQLVSLGIVGEYIARIYDEVKRRPLFVVKDQMGFSETVADKNSTRLKRVGEV